MLRNGKGSPDGLRIEDYQKDVHYTVPFDLAEGFRTAGYAVIEGDAAPEPTEAAPAVAAPEPVRAPSPPLRRRRRRSRRLRLTSRAYPLPCPLRLPSLRRLRPSRRRAGRATCPASRTARSPPPRR